MYNQQFVQKKSASVSIHNIVLNSDNLLSMISAKLYGDKILIEALPTNITNLKVQSDDIQHIEKAFTGEITAQTLSIVIGEDSRQLNNIAKFYEYLCTCFNLTQSARVRGQVLLSQDQKMVVVKETCFETGKGKKQRITIRVIMPKGEIIDPELKLQVKHEQNNDGRFQYVIRLKECFMNITTILLRCNSLILGQLEYFKMSQERHKLQLDKIYKSLTDKMALQHAQMKADLNNFIKKAIRKLDLSDEETTLKKSKKEKKKKHKQKKQVIKEQEIQNEKNSSDLSGGSPQIGDMNKDKSDEVKQQGQQIEGRVGKGIPIIDLMNGNQTDNAEKQTKELESSYVKEQDSQQILGKNKSFSNKEPVQKVIKIPIEFDTTNPAYHFFSVSSKIITKLGGFDYSIMLLTYVLPHEGTHSLTVKYALAKKEGRRACCIEVGIIDQYNKQRLHSSKWQNLIKFKFNVPAVFTNIDGKQTKKKYGKLRIMRQGESVQMTVNMKQKVISWRFSFGEIVQADIPEIFRQKTMVPFASIFSTGDMIQFIDNLQQPQKKEQF